MPEPTQHSLSGSGGNLVFFEWPNDDATFIALIAHGYGEHARRYDHVADRLVAEGAMVYAPDHIGHGLSEGERALVEHGEMLTADLHLVAEIARGAHPGLAGRPDRPFDGRHRRDALRADGIPGELDGAGPLRAR